MSNNTATKAPLEEKYNDYEKTPVPETARQTWYQQGMVWLGAGFGLSGLATGGVLADGLSFRDMLLNGLDVQTVRKETQKGFLAHAAQRQIALLLPVLFEQAEER